MTNAIVTVLLFDQYTGHTTRATYTAKTRFAQIHTPPMDALESIDISTLQFVNAETDNA